MSGITVLASVTPDYSTILTPEALTFLTNLHRAFNPTRKRLLHLRQLRQQEISQGTLPNFNKQTRQIREDDTWKGPPPAPGLVDRRVEITGPVDRKMVINALNSGASVFMADFEDSNSPTWANNMCGQINLRDAIHGQIGFTNKQGRKYQLREDGKIATLMVRPRGWHLDEAHVLIDGEPCSGSLFDFGLYFLHNAHRLISNGRGPYFYLPKLESHLEARLWNDVFNYAQDSLQIPRGTIRATVLIETILAAFEMDEIIYELRDHSAGLNCGRWDYIFSFIKKFRHDPRFVLPDRSDVTMRVPFMSAYVRLLIRTCHRRGVHAMGGMAAQIPIKEDAARNATAMDKVKQDKEREVRAGHDGTWVAHPALVSIARKVFDEFMPGPNQLYQRREDVRVSAADLLDSHVVGGQITDSGVRENISVSLRYVEMWLEGVGCVEINHLMEDAATAEIARSQIWQWCRHRSVTREGRVVDPAWVKTALWEEVERREQIRNGRWRDAAELLEKVLTGADWVDFITDGLCYPRIISNQSKL